MFKTVTSIVAESDRRIAAEDGMDTGVDDLVEEAEEQAYVPIFLREYDILTYFRRNRDFNSYKALTKLIPKLESVLADPDIEKSTSFLGEVCAHCSLITIF